MTNVGQIGKEQKAKTKKNSLEGVICSNPGEHIAPVYKRVYVKEADANLVRKVDEFDIYEFIQASKATTDLALLEKRYIELGEIPAVDPSLGSNDLASMPANIHEVYAMATDIANNFAKLPQTIQAIFGTKEAYMKSLMDGTYQATLVNAINAAGKQQEPAPTKPTEGDK